MLTSPINHIKEMGATVKCNSTHHTAGKQFRLFMYRYRRATQNQWLNLLGIDKSKVDFSRFACK